MSDLKAFLLSLSWKALNQGIIDGRMPLSWWYDKREMEEA